MPSDEALPPPPTSLPPPPIEIEKEFILSFESLPELWDKTHTLYCNKYKRNDALRKLLDIYIKVKPGATIEDVKKKSTFYGPTTGESSRKLFHREDRGLVQMTYTVQKVGLSNI